MERVRARADVWSIEPGYWTYDIVTTSPETDRSADRWFDTQQEALNAACEQLEELADADSDRIYH